MEWADSGGIGWTLSLYISTRIAKTIAEAAPAATPAIPHQALFAMSTFAQEE
jgi:hypothetical protein